MTGPAEHLVPVESTRGFKWMPPVVDSVQLFESSNAAGPHIWLRCLGLDAGLDALAGFSIELRVEDAEKLAEQILWLCRHHYQAAGLDG